MEIRFSLILFLIGNTVLHGANLPTGWSRAIVSIEVPTSAQEQAAGLGRFKQIGTGFLASPDETPPLRAVLFTAKHVFEGACPNFPVVYLRFKDSPLDPTGEIKRVELRICEKRTQQDNIQFIRLWMSHPRADVACIIPQTHPGDPALSLIAFGSKEIASNEQIKQWNVSESDEVFTISFHANLTVGRPSTPIVRSGVIAEFSEQEDIFVVSSPVFPGNSGSPVILKPVAVHLSEKGTEIGNVNPALLLGVVFDYVAYSETAVSLQTGRPRVSFEENSGLTRAVRSERIRELLQSITPMLPPRPQ